MAQFNHQRAVEKLRHFQRQVRKIIHESHRNGANLNEVARNSSADTIYGIDTQVDPILEEFCQEWGQETPLVLIAEGLEDEHGREGPVTFPRGMAEKDAVIRVIVDPIDGTRGIMYDKRAAWALAGVAPNKGPGTRLRDIEVSVMTELPTSKMGYGDVLWAVRGQGVHGLRERLEERSASVEPPRNLIGHVLTKMGKVNDEHVIEALEAQARRGGKVGEILLDMGLVEPTDIAIALAFQKSSEPQMAPEVMNVISGEPLTPRPSRAETINHGFAAVSNFFPGTKELASRLMEHLARNLIGPADVTRATVFDDQYISTGGQFYELIIGHDRFNADLRPAFYRMQKQPEGLCCHPYDCAALLIAEEAGVRITDETGKPLDGPFDTTTSINWLGYANPFLQRKIEPLVKAFLAKNG